MREPVSENTIYYVCKYTPLELFAGFGTECRLLDVTPESFDCADECAHPNLCGYGKSVLESAGELPALILTDCCDVMRRVYDVLQSRGGPKFLYFLPLPHRSGTAAGPFAGELERLMKQWGAYTGRRFDPDLARAAWERGRQAAEEAAVTEPHVCVTGAHGGHLLLDAVRARISMPVTDATCTGRRELPPCGTGDFLPEYAPALLAQARPCMRMLDSRGIPEEPGTAGVICHTVKFCDYYGFACRDFKERKETPVLKIETDCTAQSTGQLRTRLDAFAETLGARNVSGVMAESAAVGGQTPSGGTRYAAGVDSGSTSTDAVVLNESGQILGTAILPTGAGAAACAERALEQALCQAGVTRDALSGLVATGYGRETTGLSGGSVTEITCHARGAHFLYPAARTVIDIGGQDSKVIRVDAAGNVVNFIMNDKCAAGTGRFLEMMARTLELSLPEMSALGLKWKHEVVISSMCTVFAESEVVSLVAQNTPASDIIHGLNRAVAGKTVALARRLGGEPAYIMTGGVARNQGVVRALEEKLGAPVFVPDAAQLCGAIGAALLALRQP
jgi:predicted CoA-substrate-specific enzyme activase